MKWHAKKCFRVEKLPARVKREIGLFAANSIFVSSHNCYSANAHPIGKKINLLWANNRVICKLNIWKECHPQDRFLRSFHSAQDLCRTVLRICAAQCKGFELCTVQCQRFVASPDSIFLRFPTVAVSTVGSNLGREEWEGKTHHSHKHHEKYLHLGRGE